MTDGIGFTPSPPPMTLNCKMDEWIFGPYSAYVRPAFGSFSCGDCESIIKKKIAVICNIVGNDLSSQIGFILYAMIPFHFIAAVFDKLKG